MGNDVHFHTGFKNQVEISNVEFSPDGAKVHLTVKTDSKQGAGQVTEALEGPTFSTELAAALNTQGIEAPAQQLAIESKIDTAPATAASNLGDSSGSAGSVAGGGNAATIVLMLVGIPAVLAGFAIAATKLKRLRQAHARKLEEQLASSGSDESAHLIQNVINDDDAFIDTEDVTTLSSYSNVIHDEDDALDAI
jgi:hypothetical protein